MFGKSSESVVSDRHSHSVIQDGVTVSGSIEAKGDLRLDGSIEGKLVVSERLTVGASGRVMADIDAGEIIVMGLIEGTVRARRRLELRKGAKVVGDVTCPILVVEEGVFFHGNSNMKEESETTSFLGTVPGGAAKSEKDEEEKYQQIYQ